MLFFGNKKPTLKQKIRRLIETILVWAGIIMYWRWLWWLLDLYFLPSHPFLSHVLTMILGIMLLVIMGKFVEQIFGEAEDEVYL